MLEQNISNRDKLVSAIREEIVGPVKDFTHARELTQNILESEQNGTFYYHKYGGVQEEIHYGSPQRHYSSGMIYPLKIKKVEVETFKEDELELNIKINQDDADKPAKSIETQNDSEEDSLISENKFIPSTFGFTFAVGNSEKDVTVTFDCGVYYQSLINSQIQETPEDWWFRKSAKAVFLIPLNCDQKKYEVPLYDVKGKELPTFRLRLDSTIRNVQLNSTSEKIKIVTITATNCTDVVDEKNDENIMFQCEMSAGGLNDGFMSYPSAADLEATIDDEDKKFDLLYSNEKNYGFGQNCSTIWKETKGIVHLIKTTFLPEYEIKTMTPDIYIDGKALKISHASLAAASNYDEMEKILYPLIEGYKSWYKKLTLMDVLPYYQDVFKSNLKEIEATIKRIEVGLENLSNPVVFDCFRLTNLAMLIQMVNGRKERVLTEKFGDISFSETYRDNFTNLDYSNFNALSESISKEIRNSGEDSFWKKYNWRGFQIAFLLMSLESFVNESSVDRNVVDLIWFPTGGGKTEAYLSCAAFSMLYRRLRDNKDTGTDVIMRYTLRLLTADQFHRTSKLICSLEFLRRKFEVSFGKTAFSLGMWVGDNNTPNKIFKARTKFNKALQGQDMGFPLTNCPWCGAEMKVTLDETKEGTYHGFQFINGPEAFCPDKKCVFNDSIPVYFVDEQLYINPPSFLIGTVDKFVQLTWEPKARAFFGIDKTGNRAVSPPSLIIQDELHLISGPLGTLTGIYETLIEDLCTDKRNRTFIKPKIICATATIKAFDNQIKSLFGRLEANLFPPSGVDINDNFFSTIQKKENGENANGRKYVGVYPFTQGRLQTEVQVNMALLSAVQAFSPETRDPFWTILSFYNSINDIGKGLTLTEQDIPHALRNFFDTRNIEKRNRRKILSTKELTSRLESSKVSSALKEMKTPYQQNNNEAIDIVLASNIIEVGVDVDRLSLMTINGQPKTSAQYIQVSGRIGRKPTERPGLVVVEYNPTNSNDKSHFEHFIEFHQRLYSQVEETSLTPFSRFSIERGLFAVIIGFIRQNFSENRWREAPNNDFIKEEKDKMTYFLNTIQERLKMIDDTEIDFYGEKARTLLKLLSDNDYDSWEYFPKKSNRKSLMVKMTKDQDDVPDFMIPMMFSMRSVDAVSKFKVMTLKDNSKKNNDYGDSKKSKIKNTENSSEGWFD